MKHALKYAAVVLAFAALPGYAAETVLPQSALVPDGNYYTNNLGANTLERNDDGSTGRVQFGFNFTLFGTTYNSAFLNNNGNITFTGPLGSFIPSGVLGASQPIVSVYFADVDTRNPASGLLHWQLDTPGQLVATWDTVGYFSQHADLLNSFQLVLRGDNFAVPAGEGRVGFFYRGMPWIDTDTSTTAAAGFGDGTGNGFTIQGSNTSTFNSVVQNRHIWFDVAGGGVVVVPPGPPIVGAVPEPATSALLAAGMGLMGYMSRRRSKKPGRD
jgi:hypothetical protein